MRLMKTENLLALLSRVLSLTPLVVAGVEYIHANAPGETKKQVAFEALSLAAQTGAAIDPDHAAPIGEITGHIGNVIDSVVGIFNATGQFKKPGAAAAAAPVVVKR